jgi:drug/metabolite transporter (DMT)-like permease
MPLTGVTSAAIFLQEPLGAVQIGGGALILAGVWLATRRAGTAAPPTGTEP